MTRRKQPGPLLHVLRWTRPDFLEAMLDEFVVPGLSAQGGRGAGRPHASDTNVPHPVVDATGLCGTIVCALPIVAGFRHARLIKGCSDRRASSDRLMRKLVTYV